MTRIRSIKPEFWHDEKMAPLPAMDRLVFLGLISMADDYGRVHDNIKVMDAFIFPETDETVRESVANLSRIGRIERGNSSSGMKVIQIVNWDKHQKVDKPQPQKALPPIRKTAQENGENTGVLIDSEPVANHSRTVREPFEKRSLPLSPISDPLSPIPDQSLSVSETESGRNVYSDEFETFWASYPKQRRSKKGEAYRKWKLAIKKTTPDHLITRCKDYASSPVGRGGFACMPSVWLNGAMWEDAPEAWLEVNGSKQTPPPRPLRKFGEPA